MRKKEKKFLVTFHTTAGAIAMEKYCRSAGISGRLIPVPREISAGCGMAWAAPPDARAEIEKIIVHQQAEVDGTYELVI